MKRAYFSEENAIKLPRTFILIPWLKGSMSLIQGKNILAFTIFLSLNNLVGKYCFSYFVIYHRNKSFLVSVGIIII